MLFSRYSKQHSKATYLKVQQAQTKSQYVKKSYSQQSNTKILLQKASETPKAGISHQPLTTTSYPQEEMTPTNFPAFPAIAKPSKSASGLHCSNFNDINNMKQTRSEETSQTKDPFQDLLQSYSKSASNSPAPSNQTDVKPTKSASGPHCSNYGDINNMEKTQTEETSQTKDPLQNLKKAYARREEQLSEMLDILKSLRNF